MTLLGKILVIFVFILAIVLGAMVCFLHITQGNYAKGIEDRDEHIKGLRAFQEVTNAKLHETETEMSQTMKDWQASVKEKDEKIQGLQRDVEKAKEARMAERNDGTANLQLSTQDIDRFQKEIQHLQEQVDKERLAIVKATSIRKTCTGRSQEANVRANAEAFRAKSMEVELQEWTSLTTRYVPVSAPRRRIWTDLLKTSMAWSAIRTVTFRGRSRSAVIRASRWATCSSLSARSQCYPV